MQTNTKKQNWYKNRKPLLRVGLCQVLGTAQRHLLGLTVCRQDSISNKSLGIFFQQVVRKP